MDQELRQALRRAEPSPGFADRVVARLPGLDEARVPALRKSGGRRWLALALAASLVAAIGAGWVQSARRAEADQARQEVELALRITTEKLLLVQSKVQARVASYRERFSPREQS